ncbi:hypothetical protein [Cryptosporangium aurantiacum]|uniref:Uncharacterized protein n=1 Tax=Cryptosporangium aurantiacum TaxID=134849 RepID=A0A1M7R2H3_9ACTN|nr:hypothetical protein [Cryptosporangium aurantiacum]SHN38935.1 hypothetical protein SAMN05443668_106164 [Cryptosporangium aurantiacum]
MKKYLFALMAAALFTLGPAAGASASTTATSGAEVRASATNPDHDREEAIADEPKQVSGAF